LWHPPLGKTLKQESRGKKKPPEQAAKGKFGQVLQRMRGLSAPPAGQ
jgi:hypothetical protein